MDASVSPSAPQCQRNQYETKRSGQTAQAGSTAASLFGRCFGFLWRRSLLRRRSFLWRCFLLWRYLRRLWWRPRGLWRYRGGLWQRFAGRHLGRRYLGGRRGGFFTTQSGY